MSYKTIYHGSESIVEKPIFHYEGSNPNNDYGLGFYTTQDLEMAKEWADKDTKYGFVNKYSFDDRNLKILDLTNKEKYSVLNWISILLHFRQLSNRDKGLYSQELTFLEKYYLDVEDYDVVIGYRADDAYFTFPLMFLRGALTLEKLEEIYFLGNMGKQLVLISEKAFSRIKYLKVIEVDPLYHERYLRRISVASNEYFLLEQEEKYTKGTRLRDLMERSDD